MHKQFFCQQAPPGLGDVLPPELVEPSEASGPGSLPFKAKCHNWKTRIVKSCTPQIGVLYCLVWRDFPTFLWYSLLLIQPSEDSLNRAPLDQSYSGADEQRQLGCMRWNSDFSAFKARWYLFRHPVRSKKHGLTEQASYTSQHQAQIILHTRHSDILLLASVPSHIVTHFLMEVLTSPPTAWPFVRHLRDEL